MEFVYYDGEKLNKIFINYQGSFVLFDSLNKLPIKKILYKTEDEAKILLDNYIIRYIKSNLYLYDDNHNLLGEYKLSKKNIKDDFIIQSEISSNIEEDLLINKYYLKKNEFIHLYKNNTTGKYYVKFKGETEEVIEKYNIGFDTIYKTKSGNLLQTSSVKNDKWNGIPVGK